MRKLALLLILTLIVAACGADTADEPSESTAQPPETTEAPDTTLGEDVSARADVVEYCGIEDHAFPQDENDPESVEAGWAARLAVSQRQAELAPPEIEEEIALVHASLEEFVAELEAADWDYENLPPEAGTIPQQAEAAVIEFNVAHCGTPDPRCNPGDPQYCTEEQLAEFEE